MADARAASDETSAGYPSVSPKCDFSGTRRSARRWAHLLQIFLNTVANAAWKSAEV
jgi:hypothetical protein